MKYCDCWDRPLLTFTTFSKTFFIFVKDGKILNKNFYRDTDDFVKMCENKTSILSILILQPIFVKVFVELCRYILKSKLGH